jgi:2,4-dienoyl-CoA reductase-like NADH-dependent reductase (Old Yellow Enzyme family)
MKPNGLTLEDSKEAAVKLATEGIDIIDVSGGIGGSRPTHLKGEGYLVHLAQGIKSVVNVPVIAVGGIVAGSYANSIVREGRADLVAVGRAMLSDPDWAVKALRNL